MNKYYENNFNCYTKPDILYQPQEKQQIKDYDFQNLIDTTYYSVQETKITAKTYVYVRKPD